MKGLQGKAGLPLHYLAIPPSAFPTVIRGLAASSCAENARVVVEKPFGRDLESARSLNETLHQDFPEPADGVELRPQPDSEPPAQCKGTEREDVDQQMLREVEPDVRRRHVLRVSPDDVAMRVVEHEVALAARTR